MQVGNWGAPPPFEIKDIGNNKKGFFFRVGFTSEGFTSENVMIFSYYNGSFKSVLELKNAYMDNSGDCDPNTPNDCWQYSYTLTPIKERGEYYDLLFSKRGQVKQNGKLSNVNVQEKYGFVNGKYIKKD